MTTAAEIATWLNSDLDGPDRSVERLASPGAADVGSVVVVSSDEDRDAAIAGGAAVLVGPAALAVDGVAWITVPAPRTALAVLSRRFDRRPTPEGVHPRAVIDPEAHLAPDVAVGPGAVISAGASVGAGSAVGAGCFVGEGVQIGKGCRLHAHVTLYDGVTIGERAILHSGCVIGADGFGYAPSDRGALKIHHLGGVRIGDDVEIGANSCVDRGTLTDTVIGDRSKIDNLCQIGHNVHIGTDTLVAGMTGIGGSARIGDRVTLAGYVGVADHVTIHDGATIGARSGVHKDVPAGETWMGAPAQPYRGFARGLYLQGKLDKIWQFVKERS